MSWLSTPQWLPRVIYISFNFQTFLTIKKLSSRTFHSLSSKATDPCFAVTSDTMRSVTRTLSSSSAEWYRFLLNRNMIRSASTSNLSCLRGPDLHLSRIVRISSLGRSGYWGFASYYSSKDP